jgi:hypothetical protein
MSLTPTEAAARRALNRRERVAEFCPFCLSDDCARSPAVLMPFVAHRALGWQPVEIDDSWGLRTLQQGHAYSICNSVECGDCGGLFLDIRFTDRELGRLYRDYRSSEYIDLRDHYEPGYADRDASLQSGNTYVALIEDFLRAHVPLPVRVLDWGGGTGKNTPFKAQSSTFHIHDISRAPPVSGASFVERSQIDPQAYDLIVCSNVIEHVPHPLDLLDEIAANMTDATVLYLETPTEAFMLQTEGDPHRLARKRHWHEHINFFTGTALERLCALAGLEVVQMRTLPITFLDETGQVFQLACRRPASARRSGG